MANPNLPDVLLACRAPKVAANDARLLWEKSKKPSKRMKKKRKKRRKTKMTMTNLRQAQR